jgi:hypothetical protein
MPVEFLTAEQRSRYGCYQGIAVMKSSATRQRHGGVVDSEKAYGLDQQMRRTTLRCNLRLPRRSAKRPSVR